MSTVKRVKRDDATGRWLPGGGSPYPQGRAKVPHSLSDQLRAELARQAPNQPPGTTNAMAVAKAVVAIARSGGPGSVEAARWISDRVEGKVAQKISVDTETRVAVVPWLPHAADTTDWRPGDQRVNTVDVAALASGDEGEGEAEEPRLAR